MRVEVRPRATLAIIDVAMYIAEQSPASAIRFEDAVREVCDLLAQYPFIGRVFPFEHEPRTARRVIRPRGFPNHAVLHRVNTDHIEILDKFHSARDPERSQDS